MMCNFRTFVVFLGLVFVILIPCIHSLIIIRNDSMLVLDNLQITLPGATCSIKIVIFWWKKEAIVPIINMMAEDWMSLESPHDRSVMIRRARTARIILTCGYCIMGITFVFVIVMPCFGVSMRLLTNITDLGRPMPLQSHYIYDVTETPQYELTYIIQSIYIVLAMISYTGIDNFLGLLIFHICGQLEILKNRLTYLDRYMNFPDGVKNCVARHTHLLRAIAVIEDAYNITLLTLFIYFTIHFAFYGFRIMHLLDEETHLPLDQLLYLLSTILNIFIHMCLYCALGEILLARCNDIYDAAYNNKWYAVDPKVAKDLLPLLIRGAKPIYLTAGKIFPMTMATFCTLLKTSAGYVSVLHTTKN